MKVMNAIAKQVICLLSGSNQQRVIGQGKNRTDLSPQEEFQKFQDNHISKGTKSNDWSRNWRTWYTNAVQYTKKNRKG